jgi:hypothetical protein
MDGGGKEKGRLGEKETWRDWEEVECSKEYAVRSMQ